jgi:excisionase family DNA binding protein
LQYAGDVSEVERYEVPQAERKRLAAVVGEPGTGPIAVSTPGGVVELPRAAGNAVRRLLEELAAGTAVHLIADDAQLSTREAGELLGISRTYVTRLVDEGKLPAHRVGTHRRLRAADVLAYKARRAQRLAAVDAIVDGDRAAGVTYR